MFARQNPGKRRVRFPDEVVFEDEIKEQDGMAVMDMLRRASIDIDINRINSAGESMRSTAGMPVLTSEWCLNSPLAQRVCFTVNAPRLAREH